MFGSGFSWPSTSPVASAGRELGDLDRGRHRAHAGQHGGPQLHRDAAILLAGHILGRQHLFLRGEVARTLEERADDAHPADLHQLGVDGLKRGRRARIGRAQRMTRVPIDERRVEHRGAGQDLAERGEVVVPHRDRAGLDAVDHLADTAELRMAKTWISTRPPVPLLHELRHLVGVEGLRGIRHADIAHSAAAPAGPVPAVSRPLRR